MHTRHAILVAALLGAASCSRSDPDLYRLEPGKTVTYIGTDFNNGSFEDWSNSSEPPAPPEYRHIMTTRDRKPLTIPGWTFKTDGRCGLHMPEGAPHLKARFYGQFSCMTKITSDAYGQQAGFTEGTTVTVSYVQVVEYSDKHREKIKKDKRAGWRTMVYLIFNGQPDALTPSIKAGETVLLNTINMPEGYVNKDPHHVENVSHELTAGEAELANQHGIRLHLRGLGSSTEYGIDKVRMTVARPSL